MKRIRIKVIFFCLFTTGITCYSQSPNLISYQTVIRNGNNELVSNTTIGVRISILGGPEANALVYQKEHAVKTNINGLAYLAIGNGKILNGLITSIDWSKGPYFIKSETDPTGGKNYTIVVLSQMLSVPYAIYSSTAEKLTGTLPETDPVFNGSIAKGISATDTSYWNKKLNSSDTSRMLANYRTSINNKLDAKDTTLMLSNYLKKSEGINETDPLFNGSIAKGITAIDTSNWNKKLNTSDTSGMMANYRTSLNQKLNITDTAKMLVPYLRDADTTNMLANYRTIINGKLDIKDTSLMLETYLKKVESLNTDLQAILDYINLFRIISGYSYAEIDGYRYKIVRVGNQIWMAENLRTTKYRNGENIVTNYSNWPFYGQYTIGAFAQYNNNDSLGNIYGKLYNWFAVTDSRGICPLGWHIPTIPEWSTLISFLGGSQIAGGKLKFTGNTLE